MSQAIKIKNSLKPKSLILKKRWEDPVYRKKMTDRMLGNNYKIGHRHTDSFRQKRTQIMLGNQNPSRCLDVRQKQSIARLAFYKTPKGKVRIKAMQGKNSSSKRSEVRLKFSILRKKNWKNPSYRKIKSTQIKKLWKDPAYKKIMAEAQLILRKRSNKGPNKFESKVLIYINSLSRMKFKFVGAGKDAILINNASPDFINKRKKIIVLANGTYWHLGQFGIEVNDKNKRKHERGLAIPFVKVGYQVIQIWDDEFNKGKLNE